MQDKEDQPMTNSGKTLINMNRAYKQNCISTRISEFHSRDDLELQRIRNPNHSIISDTLCDPENLLNFDDILNAPEYIPTNQPMCLSKVLGAIEDTNDEEENINMFRSIQNVIKI